MRESQVQRMPANSVKFICDTRERTPWTAPKHREMVRACLPFGDYSVEGYEQRACVERKSLDDYVGSVFGDWKRFAARLTEFRELVINDRKGMAVIVVEATEEDIRKAKYRPDARSTRRAGNSAIYAKKLDALEPRVVLASTAKILAEFRVPVVLAGSPGRASTYGFNCLTFWVDRERAK
jgi:ERCC4-type nuclease